MNTLITILMLLVALFSQLPDSKIEYNPRSLQKSLEKITGCPEFSKQELIIPKSDSYDDINGKFFRISCERGGSFIVYVGRVNSCRASGCSVDNPHGEFEFFDYYCLYDSTMTVVQVNVFNYEASHGQEITSKGWLRQFIGHNAGKPLQAGKNIDAISGATISVNGIVDDIREKTLIIKSAVNQ